MTERKHLLHAFETEMIPKIYGFCRLKLNRVQDAEDLSQEICMEVLRVIRAGKEIESLNAFVWSVSNHMLCNFLRRQRRSAVVYSSDLLSHMSDGSDVEAEYVEREQKALLRRELAHMTGNYRRAIVMHYFDRMPCEAIAEALGRSVGTVKWWLHDARKAIKKGMNLMREYGEKSYRPMDMMVSCTGLPGADVEPMVCTKRKSAQNILLAAYQKPLSVEELCMELGISAPYVEDEVEYLTENQLMRRVGDKYQTDFVLLPGNDPTVIAKTHEAVADRFYARLIRFLEARRDILTNEKFNLAGFSWERLLWVYGHMITVLALDKYQRDNGLRILFSELPLRPNGGKWIAYGYYIDPAVKSARGEPHYQFNGPLHKLGDAFVEGFFHAWSGFDCSAFFDLPADVLPLCSEIVKGEISVGELNEEQKYRFSIALEKKLFLQDGDGFRPSYYFVRNEEKYALGAMGEEFCREAEDLFREVQRIVWGAYAPTVPEHLTAQMGNYLSNHFYTLIPAFYHKGMQEGVLSRPDGDGKYWLSLFVSE